MQSKDRLIVALDVPNLEKAKSLVDQLAPHVGIFKIGSELYTAEGPAAIQEVQERGGKVFLDLKFLDIPNTVEGAARSAAMHGVRMFNVHASGGLLMLEKARAGRDAGVNEARLDFVPRILAVTVLTSLAKADLDREGNMVPIRRLVLQRAILAREAKLDGVIASPLEVAEVRDHLGPFFLIVTPGVRFPDSDSHDQVRIATPYAAIKSGADFIVMGRPITAAASPVEAAKRAVREIERGLAASERS
ncbi:MAG: Orotidine 5'-phosphate decarboxylase [Parcubacteria group bacterium GW2011_GWB1_52_7]|nr:MAG: Orotidine 5'-phosphate decarboxylase [Parcubacteria group bacterium GW2011_GWA1_51_12]KKW28548.1 MAG: Orotidine 5'-phosphate decarboxylase [Parcubacteria group bacterium GW2011_GWB1_52_7]KKW31459.1 MAG: Orotidine 5'-phosphate decarboxylase [Parcubacteria group bacterium GW2011_GWC2_52_8c]